ncbi:hypothetical protein SteCoe_1980 [Stentor coeruleus]|uniref:AIG1-type G domain-containing protein n=1 Tax=Stentor coeruleus TaxID=5963 RepID=A0A1R2D0L1_9CILI|nr:hypothetical protein SteCoe_1980 [Stentor coeruleus]
MSEPEYDYCILFLGLTGSGKSSVINLIANYFEDNDPKNVREYATIGFERNSETSNVRKYIVRSKHDNKKYLLIDTPGLADTGGNDLMIRKKILESICELNFINAIVCVYNYSQNRVQPSHKKGIESIISLISDDLKYSILALLTHYKQNYKASDDELLQYFIERTKLKSVKQVISIENLPFSRPLDEIRNVNKNKWQEFMRNNISNFFAGFINFAHKERIETTPYLQFENTKNEVKLNIFKMEEKVKNCLTFQGNRSSLTYAYALIKHPARKDNNFICSYEIDRNCTYKCNSQTHGNCRLNVGMFSRFFIRVRTMFNSVCDVCGHSYANHIITKKLYQHVEISSKIINYMSSLDEIKRDAASAENECLDSLRKMKGLLPGFPFSDFLNELIIEARRDMNEDRIKLLENLRRRLN